MDIVPDITGIAKAQDGSSIHYSVHKTKEVTHGGEKSFSARQRVLMIMGLAASSDGWIPQIEDLLESSSLHGTSMDICVFDNRGIGQSSCPNTKDSYSTEIMARDAIAVVDTLGWQKFHLVGFSMGGMISMKLASLYSDRLSSLSLLGVTEGGWQVLPRSWKALKYSLKMFMANTLEERSYADLKFHFSKKTLREPVPVVGGPHQLRKHCLYEEYLESKERGGNQPPEGLNGQMHACWSNNMSWSDYKKIQDAKIPIVVLHGRQDLVAAPKFGQAIAQKLGAKFVEIEGAHLITRECAHDVSHELMRIISDSTPEAKRKRHLNRNMSSNRIVKMLDKNALMWDSARTTTTESSQGDVSE